MTEESQKVIQNEESPDEVEGMADWHDRYLRLAAELDNSKKAYERAYAHRAQQERERFLRDLLPLADNLERALEHAIPSERETSLYGGIELTLRDLWRTLEKYGVERIEALGMPFDPDLHEAVAVVPHPTLAPGTVMRVEQPGYLLDRRLLRPALVMVTAG
ncbi:MAG: nucleotide exchange factor GrpE [Chloroflexi bacterium]|nr:nucleotide exchange factor GrpE [Chloroflexota bacterium]